MELRGIVIATGTVIVTVQLGLFAWLKADIGSLTERVDRVEREVAFVRDQLSLALPSLAEANRTRTEGAATQ